MRWYPGFEESLSINGSENQCQHDVKYRKVPLIEYFCVVFFCVPFFLVTGDDNNIHTNATVLTRIIKQFLCKCLRRKRYVGGSLRAVLFMRCPPALRARDQRTVFTVLRSALEMGPLKNVNNLVRSRTSSLDSLHFCCISDHPRASMRAPRPLPSNVPAPGAGT